MTNTAPLAPANYFTRHAGCHSLCRIARGLVSDGERHDPRCVVVRDVGHGDREDIARHAERVRRDHAETTDDARCTIGRAKTVHRASAYVIRDADGEIVTRKPYATACGTDRYRNARSTFSAVPQRWDVDCDRCRNA